MKRTQGVTLVECLVAVMAVFTLAALLIPAYLRAGRHALVVECKSHLSGLFKAQASAPPGPPPLGSAFWTRLLRTDPPLLDPAMLRCPLASAERIVRDSDYFGPQKDPAQLGATDPIGCDDPENHGHQAREGGNVLLKSGEVRTLHPLGAGEIADPWREAWQQKCAR